MILLSDIADAGIEPVIVLVEHGADAQHAHRPRLIVMHRLAEQLIRAKARRHPERGAGNPLEPSKTGAHRPEHAATRTTRYPSKTARRQTPRRDATLKLRHRPLLSLKAFCLDFGLGACTSFWCRCHTSARPLEIRIQPATHTLPLVLRRLKLARILPTQKPLISVALA